MPPAETTYQKCHTLFEGSFNLRLTLDWMPGAVPRCVPVDIKRNRHGDRAVSVVIGTERILIKQKWWTIDVQTCPVRCHLAAASGTDRLRSTRL